MMGQARAGDRFELVATTEAEAVAALRRDRARASAAEAVVGGDALDLEEIAEGINQVRGGVVWFPRGARCLFRG